MSEPLIKEIEKNKLHGGKPCEMILGDAHNVAILGGFFYAHTHLMEIARLHTLMIHANTIDFDSKEYRAYKKGQDDIMDFLRKCSEENLDES